MTRWFRAGAIGLLVVAVLHTFGHFGGGPKDPARIQIEEAMNAYRFDIMGMHPSASDITNSLSLMMTIMLVFAGVLDLIVVGALSGNGRVLRRLAWVNAVGVGALAALFAYYRIPPPMATLAVVCLFFVVAALRPAARRF
ncbi:MAG TPA: hypothetical protein VEC56_06385 [Candidatus Krumholzibacteria bacterium]|nr:hypothetical protein [Candidatus Krumholzibacteria bacterium]